MEGVVSSSSFSTFDFFLLFLPSPFPPHAPWRAWLDGWASPVYLHLRTRLSPTRPAACNIRLIGCMHRHIQVPRGRCLVALFCFVLCAYYLSTRACEHSVASAGPGSPDTLDFHVPGEPGSSCTAAWPEPDSNAWSGNQTTQNCIRWAWPTKMQLTKQPLRHSHSAN